VGGNADDKYTLLGNWAWPRFRDVHPKEGVVTLVDGIKSLLGDKTVRYAFGCDSMPEYNLSRMGSIDPTVNKSDLDRKPTDLREAIEVAKDADVIVAAVGDHLTVAGEGIERADLSLSHDQTELLKLMKGLGKPLVIVLVNNKPLTIPWVIDIADAVIEAWTPGCEGGTAIAEALFGKLNPSGKLTVSWPRHIGQQPVWYNQTPGWHGLSTYVEESKDPLFHFGYGLSYTTYAYDNLKIDKTKYAPDETINISVDVKNTGKMAGTEIVQVYMSDLASTVSTPIKALKEFSRVTLRPGQKKTVRFSLPVSEFWLINEEFEKAVEAGEFAIMIGSSSAEKDLLVKTIEVTTTKILDRYL
jgi:beta-glucosidase